MILACPFCHARYLISASLFTAGPRQVRCARCSHGWQAELPKEIDAVGAPPVVDPTPESVAPIPPGSNLPVIRKKSLLPEFQRVFRSSGAVAVFAFFLLGLVLGRHWVAEEWPFTESLYDAVGLHIYRSGEGLGFENVRSELRYEGGITLLGVEGNIRNSTPNMQEIPDIMATAIGADGNSLQSWRIDAPAIKVAPGEVIPFRSSIKLPQGTVAEINLEFTETKHDPDQ